jgi:transcriptional regulator with PAS, ATPase and Fis domain
MKFLTEELGNVRYQFDEIIGRTQVMQNVFKLIEQVAATNVTVLISGESGTGKELVANSIHKRSSRAKKSFIPVNMGAISPELIISELFGHEKGAYTGAVSRKAGRFERANHGTLFMDEISTMDYRTQISLLRVLETNNIQPIGARNLLPVDVRVIGATNRELLELVQQGTFREDLYYRFNVFSIHLPPLRERKDDISLIANEYVQQFAKRYKKKLKMLSAEICNLLYKYDWPGNVRELKNVIHRAVVLSEEREIIETHLPSRILEQKKTDDSIYLTVKVGTSLDDAEKAIIQKTLDFTQGNKQKTARLLGISRKSLYNKMQKFTLNE